MPSAGGTRRRSSGRRGSDFRFSAPQRPTDRRTAYDTPPSSSSPNAADTPPLPNTPVTARYRNSPPTSSHRPIGTSTPARIRRARLPLVDVVAWLREVAGLCVLDRREAAPHIRHDSASSKAPTRRDVERLETDCSAESRVERPCRSGRTRARRRATAARTRRRRRCASRVR